MAVADWFFASDEDSRFFDSAKLGDVARWAAAGFTALVAILTFFGIKEAVLDQLLRSAPTAALFVFLLVGLGVVSSLFAPALVATKRVYGTWIVVAVTVIALLTWMILPNLDESTDQSRITLQMSVLVLLVLVLLAFLLIRVPVSITAALLIFAVACISMGLYGAAKLSVLSKTFSIEPQVTATIKKADDRQVLEAVVQAKRQDKKVLFLSLVGIRNQVATDGKDEQEQEQVLGKNRLPPDAAGEISATVSFPIVTSTWHQFIVRTCDAEPCSAQDERVRLAGELPEAMRLSGTLTPGSASGAVTATIDADGIPKDKSLTVTVIRERGGRTGNLARLAVLSNGSGVAAWKGTIRSLRNGDRLILRCQLCSLGLQKCKGRKAEVATLAIRQ